MSQPALAFATLAGDAAAAVARVPSAPGVGQVLGPGGRSLVLGTSSNLRRWAASHLGLGPPPAAGRRPRTNLLPVADTIAWAETDGAFRQRLLYERLMAPLVPLAARRDLPPPAFLHLDFSERFPRLSVRPSGAAGLYGPFRSRLAAEKARDGVHRRFPLRPCDFAFEPDPALPLGLSCLFAQVRSCTAPCLARIGEADYRSLAARAAAWLADPRAREGATPAVPSTVAAVDGLRALVVDAGRRSVGLYPVRAGRVLDASAIVVPPGGVDEAIGRLAWPEAAAPDDWPWLSAWLGSPKGRTSYVLATEDASALRAAVRSALPARRAGRGDNVGTSREGA